MLGNKASWRPVRHWGLFALLVALAVPGCSSEDILEADSSRPPLDFSGLTISQGIAGHVWFWEGNFMPLGATGTVKPANRWVLVFPDLPDSLLTEVSPGGFYPTVPAQALDSVFSDSIGFFQMSLGPGQYRVFVREDGVFYRQGSHPERVHPDSVTTVHIDIQYKAVW